MKSGRAFVVAAVAALVAGPTMTAGCAVSREVGSSAFHLMTQTNPSPPARRALPGGIVGVCSRGSLSWVVPVEDGGVVVIDTGFDDAARSIKHVVGDRVVHAILLTHGHVDHAAGTAAFTAPVYVGRADAPALRGEHVFDAWYPLAGEALAGIPRAGGEVVDVDDGDVVVFGNRRFRAIAMPGHTHGSIAWYLEEPDHVLFGGDALLSPLGDEVYPAAVGFTVDVDRAYRSIRRLRDVEIDWLADAHYGVLRDPSAALQRAVARDHDDDARRSFPLFRPVGCGDDPA